MSYRVTPSNDEAHEALGAFSPLVRTLLCNRGITTKEEADMFLHPEYGRDIHDPFLMKDMDRAVGRILSAIQKNEKVVIYSDYDCDGIPGGVVLHDFFTKIGYEHFSNYIPHRHKEGYGINTDAVERLAEEGNTLMITVDCGITDNEEVAHAHDLGMEVIVTDHHLPGETLPPAHAILNPKQKGDTYPDPMLCGSGVAYKLVQALLIKGRKEGMFGDVPLGWEKTLLDMVGLATIADMVPLKHENRALAHFGLTVLRMSRRPGLQRLLRKAKVDQRYLTEMDVGFTIGPRINAASRMRMAVPMDAFHVLASRSETVADEMVEHIESINTERKLLVARIVKEAKVALAKRTMREVIVVGNPRWRVGVLGIVANNLAEEYERPAFVWGREQEVLKGSCRSDGSVNVVELMYSVREHFMEVGGHAFSGGFAVSQDYIHTLEDKLSRAYEKAETTTLQEDIMIDAELALSDVTFDTYAQIEQLAPFGIENPAPLFLFRGVEVAKASFFGRNKEHVRLAVRDNGGHPVSAIRFFAKKEEVPQEGERINLVAEMEKSYYGGNTELRLRFVDML